MISLSILFYNVLYFQYIEFIALTRLYDFKTNLFFMKLNCHLLRKMLCDNYFAGFFENIISLTSQNIHVK